MLSLFHRTKESPLRFRILAAAAVAGLLALFAPSVASAATCIPGTDPVPATYATEYQYQRTVPAVGEPEITNPDYVAPQDAQGEPTIVVQVPNPDYIAPVDHPAKYATHYQWKWWGWVDHGATTWTDGTYPTFNQNIFPGEWRKNGQTKPVEVEKAWTSPAVGTPTIDQVQPNPDYIPAVEESGTPTIPNPDYRPAHDETSEWIELPGVPEGDGWTVLDERQGRELTPAVAGTDPVCTEDPVVVIPTDPTDPPVVVDPVVAPVVPEIQPVPTAVAVEAPQALSAAPATQDDQLAVTGSETTAWWIIAITAILVGAAALTARKLGRR